MDQGFVHSFVVVFTGVLILLLEGQDQVMLVITTKDTSARIAESQTIPTK